MNNTNDTSYICSDRYCYALPTQPHTKECYYNRPQHQVSEAINKMANFLHDATCWNQQDERDENGFTPLQRLVEEIDEIYRNYYEFS